MKLHQSRHNFLFKWPMIISTIIALCSYFVPIDVAFSQTFSLDLGEGGPTATERIIQLFLLVTVMALAPSILVMTTSFIRIVIVLSFLRTAIGAQQTPPNQVLTVVPTLSRLIVLRMDK